MADMSYLDKKYFIDSEVYNCPYCNRNNVQYSKPYSSEFDWSAQNKCYIYFIKCSSCGGRSMHLSF